MRTPAEVIRRILIDQSLGKEFEKQGDWFIMVSFLKDSPDNAICIYDTSGRQDGRIMGTGEQVIHPGVQVLIRGKVYQAAWEKAYNIAVALDAVKTTVANVYNETYTVQNVSRTGDILPLGQEPEGDRRRYIFTINAVLTLKKE